tara:strand:- start:107 stop:802 length:696 start_codon:yes stop_codon:yes gene_type:complete
MDMIQYKDLLIVGDSFCGHRTHQDHWPQIVMQSLTGLPYNGNVIPKGYGFPGASWWSVRKHLLEQLKAGVPKVVIFCHTEPHRLPHPNDWGVNTRSVELAEIHVLNKTSEPMPEAYATAAQLYYEQLWMLDYHHWAITQWFKELDELTLGIEKVLHFYCFDGEYKTHTFKNGVTFDNALINHQVKKKMFTTKTSPEANHFDVETNRHFAEVIVNYINNYPGDGVRITERLL